MKLFPLLAGCALGFFSMNVASAQDKETAPIKPVTPVENKAPAPPKPAAESKPKATAPVPQAKPVEKEPETYVIKSGDNPWAIAKKHNVSLAELMKLNEIKDAKNLKVGDTLILPKGTKSTNPAKPDKITPVAEKPAPVEEKEGDNWTWYTIAKGENPWTVAKKLKVDHQEIMSLNEGTDFRDLKIGQKIKVPKK